MAYAAKAFRDAAMIRFRPLNDSTIIPAHSRHFSDFSKISSDWLDQSSDFTLKEGLIKPSSNSQEPKDQNTVLEQEHQILVAHIHYLVAQTKQLSKHELIRIKEWLTKLSPKQTNPVWMKNIIFYLRVLAEMIRLGSIGWPFNNLPTGGSLPKLSIYDVPYPLRQRLSQSKEKSKSRKPLSKGSGRDKNEKKQSLKKQRESNLLNQISLLKGFDLNQSSMLNKKVSLGNIPAKSNQMGTKALKNSDYFQFETEEIQLSNPIKPNYSNKKTRKDHLQSNTHQNSHQNKPLNLKPNCRKQIQEQQGDKQNNPYAINISRKLFNSKEKQSKCSADSKRLRIQNDIWNQSQVSNTFQLDQTEQNLDRNSRQEEGQHPSIFGKMYKILQDNETALGDKPQYCSLLQEIKNIGKQLQLPEFQQPALDQSTLSDNSKAILRVRQQIKHKFEETDNQTLEFMNFLQRVRNKGKSCTLQNSLLY